jgi:hypothetical protein
MGTRILILEDDGERVAAFRQAALALGADLRVWCDARRMMRELAEHVSHAALISLDHDLIAPKDKTGATG